MFTFENLEEIWKTWKSFEKQVATLTFTFIIYQILVKNML